MEIVSTPAVEDETIFVPRCNWHHPLRQDPRCIARLSNLTIHFFVQHSTTKALTTKGLSTSLPHLVQIDDYHEKTIGKCIQETK